ncbi:MAG: hypothetical protein ACXWLF_07360 [Myxococcaceae bacterium]
MPGETERPVDSSPGGPLEARLEALAGRVDQLEQRVSELSSAVLPQSWPPGEPAVHDPAARAEMGRWVTFVGRSCLVLGGAFLIRVLTDGGILPGPLGVGLGVLFAATWVFFSHRAAARGASLSASFHAVVGALIAYPLVLEATTRLGVMSTIVAALTLVAFTGLLLVAAWRDRLLWLAWIGVLSCLLTTLALLVATRGRPELTGVLLILAAATFLWPGDEPGWRGLRWAPAVALDLVVLRAVLTSTPPVLFPSLALAGLSLGLALSRTAAARPVGAFEVFQTLVGLSVGLTGAMRVTRGAGAGTGALAVAVLGASLLTAAVAGWVVPRRGNRDRDFLFLAALSLALLSLGVALLTTGNLRGVLWSAIALLVVLVGRRRHPVSLWYLAALLALAAASSSGLLAGLWQTLGGRDAVHWRPVSAATMAVLAFVILDYLVTVPPLRPSVAPPTGGPSPRAPAAVLLLLASAGVAALVLEALHPVLQDLARLGGARTVVAVAVAASLALIRRRLARPELTWVASLVLALGGLELLLVELPNGRASTLLVSFVLHGAGLILVPRLAPPGRDFLSSSLAR